jgi:hypothetical protein
MGGSRFNGVPGTIRESRRGKYITIVQVGLELFAHDSLVDLLGRV